MYKKMMFPEPQQLNNGSVFQAGKWTMAEIDQLDVHFFYDLMDNQEPQKKVYIDQVW